VGRCALHFRALDSRQPASRCGMCWFDASAAAALCDLCRCHLKWLALPPAVPSMQVLGYENMEFVEGTPRPSATAPTHRSHDHGLWRVALARAVSLTRECAARVLAAWCAMPSDVSVPSTPYFTSSSSPTPFAPVLRLRVEWLLC